jgi:hypothetical protein
MIRVRQLGVAITGVIEAFGQPAASNPGDRGGGGHVLGSRAEDARNIGATITGARSAHGRTAATGLLVGLTSSRFTALRYTHVRTYVQTYVHSGCCELAIHP